MTGRTENSPGEPRERFDLNNPLAISASAVMAAIAIDQLTLAMAASCVFGLLLALKVSYLRERSRWAKGLRTGNYPSANIRTLAALAALIYAGGSVSEGNHQNWFSTLLLAQFVGNSIAVALMSRAKRRDHASPYEVTL